MVGRNRKQKAGMIEIVISRDRKPQLQDAVSPQHKRICVNSQHSWTAMEHLVTELNVLLKLLDHETLSSATAEKKTAVRNLLKQLQPSDCDLQPFKDTVEEQKAEGGEETPETPPPKSNCQWVRVVFCVPQSPVDSPPPLPTTPPPEDYYEEAVPLSPGKMPQYITTRSSSSPPNSIEDGYYEDADNNYPITRMNGQRKNSYNDSDALSSSYESYDEEEDETKAQRLTHQWPSEENSMGPVKDCRICAFLLRKKRFGQWAKQLTVIRESRLQCYKSSKDHRPSMDVPLNLCTVSYVPKDGRRKKHELRFLLPGGETLVLAVQSKEQAEGWLRIIREVNGQSPTSVGLDGSISPMIQRKTDLDKRLSADKQTSDSDSVATGDNVSSSHNRETREGKAKRGALSELTGSVSRAAGRKITRIISFSKKKPPLPGDPRTPSSDEDDPRCGYLSVLVNQCWRERWCCVRSGSLFFYRDRTDLRTHMNMVALRGCEVIPGLGPKHPFAFRIMRGGNEVTALEASCSEDMGRWLGVLLAETGCAADPESLHYDYVDVETIANIRDAARHSFLWATSSSGASTDSRTYDDVPYERVQPEGEGPEPGTPVKRHASFSSRDTEKVKPQVTVKRHGSNTNLYGKYGKTRAEEDARRYLSKQKISLEERVAQLEESCREKEAERVDLELKLTVVKDNLKKSLAGGALGAPEENRPIGKVLGSRSDGPYGETPLPVNCASEMRKRPPSIYASTKGNVMQKAKEWESKKGT
ncbi:hypothetical protein JZ751_007102 [Albula glossodonta]|uniref:Actin filament-associated protein 1-like 1 n=1 Tax=Albula glossodonta TaxID=121402 RepID=A0A8T2P080_9TELE|nr:hypothetical protein JZ751_007102 [Albula glossodonta]